MGVESSAAVKEAPGSSARDFDFLHGRWNVVNRRLKQRWVGSQDWDVFPATQRAWDILSGGLPEHIRANIEAIRRFARGSM